MIQSHLNSSPVDPSLGGPIAYSECKPVERQISCVPAVSLLFGIRCPSYIAWFIIAFIVDTVERMFTRWRLADRIENIRQKRFKYLPAFANCDAATAIAIVPVHAGITASSYHTVPSSPQFGFFLLTTLAVAESARTYFHSFIAKTTTALRSAHLETVAGNDPNRSTLALTKPKTGAACVIDWAFGLFEYGPAAKCFTKHEITSCRDMA